MARYLGVPLHTWDAARLDKGAGDVLALRDDAVLEVNGADVRVLPTPGHSSDSVCFVAGTSILTGDTVLGRGTTLVAHPDGRLADYLASLQTLAEECREHEIATLLPGHGPPLDDPDGVVEAYLKHRHERLDEICAVMKAGASTVEEIMDRVYADLPVEVRPAAIATVRAQIEFLDND